MKKFVTRAIIIALIGSTGILSGCYGPFRLTTKLHQWNGNVSNKKFVNDWYSWDYVSYLLMNCVLGGCIDFQPIEFWGGQNPITRKTVRSTSLNSCTKAKVQSDQIKK